MLNDDNISNEEINRIMQFRKPHLNNQVESCNVRAKLCNSIQKIKLRDPELIVKLDNLKSSDRKLYDYIYNLETINDGIWCDKCSTIKNTSSAEDIINGGMTDLLDKSHQQIKQFSTNINNILSEFISKIDAVCLDAANLEESLKNQYIQFALKNESVI